MNKVFHTTMRRRLPAALVSLAVVANVHAAVQDEQPGSTPPVSEPATREQSPVKINAKKNAGDLSYKSFFGIQTLLQSFLPPEPRVIDFTYRLSFTEIDGAARDEYDPQTWGVAIVGDTFDQVVPVDRGGYFLLPNLPQAVQESATVMFNTQTRWRSLNVAFKLRLAPEQTLAYADFARAIDEFKAVQGQVPWYRFGLRAVRTATVDGLRACFRSADARIEIDGMPAPTRIEGMCHMLKFDPAKAAAGPATIAFVGPLDNVTLNDREP